MRIFHYICIMNTRLTSLFIVCLCSVMLTATYGSNNVSLYTRMQHRFNGNSPRMAPGYRGEWPRQAYLCLDLARDAIGVDRIYSPDSPDIIPFTGKGVTIAVIDAGIDPRHIAFSDSGVEGSSRVKRYMRTFSKAETESGELEWKVSSEVSGLGDYDIDTAGEGHGTHVAGIAAGADCGNPYRGIAPEADLYFVSMGEALYDDEIALGLASALDYARETGTPMVLNFSIGQDIGSKRGDNPVTELLAGYSASGNIALFAAGNDGVNPICLDKDFSVDATPLCTAFARTFSGTAAQSLFMDSYSLDSREFEIAVAAVDITCQKEVWRSEFIPASSFDSDGICVLLDTETGYALFPELADYFKGIILLGKEIYNGDYHMMMQAQFDDVDYSTKCTLAIVVRSAAGAHVSLTSSFQHAYFRSYGIDGYTSGTPAMSISDYCTSPYVVSVGAWNTRSEWMDIAGTSHKLDEAFYGTYNGVGTYSSYGSVRGDADNILPHVLAPGTDVISSLPPTYAPAGIAFSSDCNGQRQLWGPMTGTSMACPAAAGVVALWLQAAPTLTRDQVLEVMRATSHRDDNVDAASNGGAYGKLDAYEGLKYILSNLSAPGTVTDICPDKLMVRHLAPGEIECVMPFATQGGTVEVYSPTGGIEKRNTFSGTVFRMGLTAGLHLIKAVTPQGIASQKVMIR